MECGHFKKFLPLIVKASKRAIVFAKFVDINEIVLFQEEFVFESKDIPWGGKMLLNKILLVQGDIRLCSSKATVNLFFEMMKFLRPYSIT